MNNTHLVSVVFTGLIVLTVGAYFVQRQFHFQKEMASVPAISETIISELPSVLASTTTKATTSVSTLMPAPTTLVPVPSVPDKKPIPPVKQSIALLVNPGIFYPIGGEKWQQGGSYNVKWNRGEMSEPVSIEAYTQDYGEKTPNNCKVFFGVDNVDPLLGEYSFRIPSDACTGRYKIQICEYDKTVLEKSVCYEDKGFFQISPNPEISCSNPGANTEWGDGLYGCSSGRDQSLQKCYNGECKICSGTLAYDQSANKIGCWYLADPGMSCKVFCEGRGLGDTIEFSKDIWGDDQSCTNGKKLTGCNKCSTNYNNGYWTPYYDIAKNICYHYPGAGVYYTAFGKPDSTSYQRLCVCNY